MPGLPTGTVTFLFTDIEGSTALLQRLGDRQYAKVLEEHRRLLCEAFAEGPARLEAAGAAMLPQVRSFVGDPLGGDRSDRPGTAPRASPQRAQGPDDRRPECHERQHEIGRQGTDDAACSERRARGWHPLGHLRQARAGTPLRMV